MTDPTPILVGFITLLAGLLGGFITLLQTQISNRHNTQQAQAERDDNRRKDEAQRQNMIRREKADFYLEILRPLREERGKMQFWFYHSDPNYKEFQDAIGYSKTLILTIPDPHIQTKVKEWDKSDNKKKLELIDEVIMLLGERVYESLFQIS